MTPIVLDQGPRSDSGCGICDTCTTHYLFDRTILASDGSDFYARIEVIQYEGEPNPVRLHISGNEREVGLDDPQAVRLLAAALIEAAEAMESN